MERDIDIRKYNYKRSLIHSTKHTVYSLLVCKYLRPLFFCLRVVTWEGMNMAGSELHVYYYCDRKTVPANTYKSK